MALEMGLQKSMLWPYKGSFKKLLRIHTMALQKGRQKSAENSRQPYKGSFKNLSKIHALALQRSWFHREEFEPSL